MDAWVLLSQHTQIMWVQSLGQEDPLEEEMATHSNILAREIPGTELDTPEVTEHALWQWDGASNLQDLMAPSWSRTEEGVDGCP